MTSRLHDQLCGKFAGIYKKYLLKLISEHGTATECQVNVQKSVIFLYTDRKQKKSFTVASRL